MSQSVTNTGAAPWPKELTGDAQEAADTFGGVDGLRLGPPSPCPAASQQEGLGSRANPKNGL